MKRIQDVQDFNHELQLNEKPTTFIVKIIYSNNQTIQGYLHWLEVEKSVPFRSFMEMLVLISEAMDTTEEMQFRSWKNAKKRFKAVRR